MGHSLMHVVNTSVCVSYKCVCAPSPQLRTLSSRLLRNTYRHPFLVLLNFVATLSAAIAVGLIFRNSGQCSSTGHGCTHTHTCIHTCTCIILYIQHCIIHIIILYVHYMRMTLYSTFYTLMYHQIGDPFQTTDQRQIEYVLPGLHMPICICLLYFL